VGNGLWNRLGKFDLGRLIGEKDWKMNLGIDWGREWGIDWGRDSGMD